MDPFGLWRGLDHSLGVPSSIIPLLCAGDEPIKGNLSFGREKMGIEFV